MFYAFSYDLNDFKHKNKKVNLRPSSSDQTLFVKHLKFAYQAMQCLNTWPRQRTLLDKQNQRNLLPNASEKFENYSFLLEEDLFVL